MTTEKSADDAVLNDVFSSGRDRGADPAAPIAEEPQKPDEAAQPKGEADKPRGEQDADGKPKGYRDPSTGRFVPLEELKTEREKRQEAQRAFDEEARLRKEVEGRNAEYQRRLDDLERRINAAPQQPRQQPQPPPDPLVDPEGALAHLNANFQQQMLSQRLNFSEWNARGRYGDQTVDAAFKAAADAGVIQQFVHLANPYDDLVNWHKRKQAIDRVGADPDAFEKRIREEERQRTIEELRTGKVTLTGNEAQPPPQQRFPQGLGSATASGPNGAQPVSDEAVMADVFGSGRKRK